MLIKSKFRCCKQERGGTGDTERRYHNETTESIDNVNAEQNNEHFQRSNPIEENGVVINQNSYVKSLEEIPIADKSDVDKELTVEEYKLFRGAIGKLSWL